MRDPAPRRVRLTPEVTASRRTQYNIGSVVLAGLFFWAIQDVRGLEYLQTQGRRVQAIVTDKEEVTGKNHSYTLYYTYPAYSNKTKHSWRMPSSSKVSASQYNVEVGKKSKLPFRRMTRK